MSALQMSGLVTDALMTRGTVHGVEHIPLWLASLQLKRLILNEVTPESTFITALSTLGT